MIRYSNLINLRLARNWVQVAPSFSHLRILALSLIGGRLPDGTLAVPGFCLVIIDFHVIEELHLIIESDFLLS